jgi:hypothetical protein
MVYRNQRLLLQSESPPPERKAYGSLLEGGIWKYFRFKSECRNSKSETNSNALNSNDQNKKIVSIPFHGIALGYTFGTSLILNIGNSDFGFVSYFEFRASNFLGIFSPCRDFTVNNGQSQPTVAPTNAVSEATLPFPQSLQRPPPTRWP